ncbi:protein of unknown function [Streptococcus thermophilus]|nr:protein of unknown function [Streptococcus thermophilus]
MAVQTVTGWLKKTQIIGTDITDKPVTVPNLTQCRKKLQDLKKKTKF